jgi:hypothetical protein
MKRPTRQTPSGRAYLDLQNQARRQNRPTQELLLLYALERWLARLEASTYASDFVLKGGMLLAALDARRTTVDADLLGRGISNDEEKIAGVIADVAQTEIGVDDGVRFDRSTIETQAMRESDQYAGVRVTMAAGIASAKLSVRLDVNFGDPVVPSPNTIILPSLRPDLPDVSMLGYPVETVLAEKLCTAITLGAANTRIRDYADVYTLITRHSLRFEEVKAAFDATATYRAAQIEPFAEAVRGFTDLRSNSYRIYRTNLATQGEHLPPQLGEVVALIASFVAPLIERDAPVPAQWNPTTRHWVRSHA